MIVLTGGGTGGHLAIARSLAEALKKRGEEIAFIGSTSGQDMAWFDGSGEFSATIFLPSKGVVNKRGLAKISAAFSILKLAIKARSHLKNINAKAVISVGGYSAAPASLAALSLNLPLFIHEQNAAVGRLNSLLKPFARGFYSSYAKGIYTNYPVKDEFFSTARVRSELKTVLFLGGSQGAKAINELAINLYPKLNQIGVKILHQCGKGSIDTVLSKYKNLGANDVEVFEFSTDMPNLMSKADLAISRAGASSVWELAANALPAVFIPYPYAASDHQRLNALALKDCSKICLQNGSSVDANEIWDIINSLNLKAISMALKEKIKPNGADAIVADVLSKL
ncbi:undecaprenyldiphospho-muramoylpentapeptide beta-N-acetylglucosaminyltransferase [Campylobacter sp. 19-13652]|uniref:undecaprenyldiphospho-muramoylpentapeptide beta-N-acetylglucosaminyltransferase n=1 Tax=Campylobacter sp. 19-13652 TaxID=2840180 RepID=UPI001C778FE8|nr:undecaprenyldiphospho-muramoylpentapeptide beta-N-acetylglucosaminyltransferase [Campylobacter sp. 19-13652]BCX79672.1 UDP-N-acetylglucosamine--N-acetylmuramyl-(pentapeptide) pyrophosphoryl-undecaprenol N-acetylglucosamine transferase [Campylobacter sp. 19-13652]